MSIQFCRILTAAAVAMGLTLSLGVSAQSQQNAPEEEKKEEKNTYASPFEIQEVIVRGQRSGGYGAYAVGSSGRLAQSYIDTPQLVSVVPSEFFSDAKLYTATDVLKFIPDVQVWATHDPQVYIRGILTPAKYVDGYAVSNYGLNFDAFFVDRVEVVKGPSSASFGRGDPAGFINYVSKRPTFSNGTEVEAIGNVGNDNGNGVRFTLDNNGFVGQGQDTAYRLNLLGDRGSGTRQFSDYARNGAQLSVTHNFSDSGRITVLGQYQRNREPSVVGNPAFIDPYLLKSFLIDANNPTPGIPVLGKNTAFGYNGDHFNAEVFDLSAILEYRLSENWHTRQAISYNQNSRYGKLGAGNPGSIRDSAGVLTVFIPELYWDFEDRNLGYQGDIYGKYPLDVLGKGSEVTILFGGDYTHTYDYQTGLFGATPRQPLLNFNNADPKIDFPNLDTQALVNDGNNWGAYAQVGMDLLNHHLQLSASGRQQSYKVDGTFLGDGSVTKTKNHTPITPRYSVVYKVTDNISLYGLMSRHEDAGSAALVYNGLPPGDPRANDTFVVQPKTDLNEFGIKGNVFGNKISFALCNYDETRVGAAETVGIGIGAASYSFRSNDKVRGWEMEIFGRPTERMTFMVASAFGINSSTKIGVPEFSAISAIPFYGTPNSLSGYAKYDFGSKTTGGIELKAGGTWYFSGWNMSRFRDAPYPKSNGQLDAGISYHFPHDRYSVELKVNNISNTLIVAPYQSDGRLIFISGSAKF